MSDERKSKTVCDSRIEVTSLMRPHQANFAGNVHGGVVLSMMDEAAYLCASRFAEAYCVTAALDHVEFQAPVRVGEMVTIRAAVGEDRTPVEVPRLITETAGDRRWRCEAELRKELRGRFEEELEAGRCAFELEEAAKSPARTASR